MKNAITLILFIAGIVLLILAVNTYQESTTNVDLLGMELSASDETGQQTAVLYFILGLLGLGGGYFTWKKG